MTEYIDRQDALKVLLQRLEFAEAQQWSEECDTLEVLLERLNAIPAADVRCTHGDGVTVEVGGTIVDPCRYREVQILRNVTIHILKCSDCGHIEIEWERQENTEDVTDGN